MKLLKRPPSLAAIEGHVGGRIREQRIMAGLTQKQFAKLIGVTYRQLLKYERGVNRVSAGRLYEIARLLSTPITDFYEGAEQQPAPSQRQRMMLELARNFAEIQNETYRETLSHVVRALAGR